jgi:hypothetical protein
VTTTTINYQSGRAAAVSKTDPAWVTTANTCASSSGSSSSGGNDNTYYDVDGDGIGDFDNYQDADAYRQEYGGYVHTSNSCEARCDGSNVSDSGERDDSGAREDRSSSGGGFWSGVKNFFTGGGSSGDGGSSSSGGGGGGCFLTTAVVERRGEADDGPTLTALRSFRDEVMANDPELRPFIAEYYALAPAIVAAIPTDDPEWAWIESQIELCVELIEAGDTAQTFKTYQAMVLRLQKRWLSPTQQQMQIRHSNLKERAHDDLNFL